MATKGNNELNKGIPEIKDAFVVMVKTAWNAHIVDRLEEGCNNLLLHHGIKTKTITVPGAFEIPFAINNYYKKHSNAVSAFIALGTIIRGDTPHFDYVCKGVTDGILQLNLLLDIPTIFGVLTLDNEEQAYQRIGGIHGHKGEEAALTAIKMIAVMREIL